MYVSKNEINPTNCNDHYLSKQKSAKLNQHILSWK